MIQPLSILTWIKGHFKTFLILTLIASFVVIYWLWQEKTALKIDNARISDNFEQKDRKVSQMSLTIGEYDKLQMKSKTTIDSLLEVIDKKTKDLKEATVIEESFKDTNLIEPEYSKPQIQKQDNQESLGLTKPIYSIPVSLDSDCWGMKGVIKSTDPEAKLFIKERIFNNSLSLLVVKKKKFLWWTIRREQFRAFSDCQKELKVTRINFVKK